MKCINTFIIPFTIIIWGLTSCTHQIDLKQKLGNNVDLDEFQFMYSAGSMGSVQIRKINNVKFYYVYNLVDSSKLECIFTNDSNFILNSKYKVGYVLEDTLLQKESFIKTIPCYARYFEAGNGWLALDTLAPKNYKFSVYGFIQYYK